MQFGQGVVNPNNTRIDFEMLHENDPLLPIVIDAGVGTARDVTIAMAQSTIEAPGSWSEIAKNGTIQPNFDGFDHTNADTFIDP